eukprot:SAG31_NODE_42645_length_270_cov_1.192982_1_plen_43_part_10
MSAAVRLCCAIVYLLTSPTTRVSTAVVMFVVLNLACALLELMQ